MLIESKIKNGHDSMFNVPQAYFKSAHLLNKMALVQFQCSRTVHIGNFHVPMKLEGRIFKKMLINEVNFDT